MNRFLLLGCFCCLPLHQMVLTSGFGYRIHPLTGLSRFHSGIDLRAHADTAFAVLPGKIDTVGFDAFLGIYVRLVQGKFSFTYGHLSQIFVLRGDSIIAGTPIGLTGISGKVTGEHLHFSIRFQGKPVDPILFFRAGSGDLLHN